MSETMSEDMSALRQEMIEANTRARRAEELAGVAESRATEAAESAGLAADRADLAEEEAQARREEALEAWRAQKESKEEARRAREEKKKAQEEAYQAGVDAKLAELEAEDVKKELERLKAEREKTLDRLQNTLGKIAETRRSKLGLVMDLGDSIEFDFDEAALRPKNRELLSRIAGVLMTTEDFHIQVYGHTDDVGGEEYNQMLSEQRADAVRDYLVEAGLDPDILTTRGYGKSQPLVEGTSPEARQRNRRVEIAVVHVTGELPENPLVGPP